MVKTQSINNVIDTPETIKIVKVQLLTEICFSITCNRELYIQTSFLTENSELGSNIWCFLSLDRNFNIQIIKLKSAKFCVTTRRT